MKSRHSHQVIALSRHHQLSCRVVSNKSDTISTHSRNNLFEYRTWEVSSVCTRTNFKTYHNHKNTDIKATSNVVLSRKSQPLFKTETWSFKIRTDQSINLFFFLSLSLSLSLVFRIFWHFDEKYTFGLLRLSKRCSPVAFRLVRKALKWCSLCFTRPTLTKGMLFTRVDDFIYTPMFSLFMLFFQRIPGTRGNFPFLKHMFVAAWPRFSLELRTMIVAPKSEITLVIGL